MANALLDVFRHVLKSIKEEKGEGGDDRVRENKKERRKDVKETSRNSERGPT